MAHSPVTRPDPFAPGDSQSVLHDDKTDRIPSFSQLLNAFSDCGAGSVSADVALDLVLNEIVQRARHASGASAAAIALLRNGEMVCRATTGENAPDLGIRVGTGHGLSGTCVQTAQCQHCEDTANDPRVDPAVCRSLGVRSILVCPVIAAKGPIGVIEIFSVHPKAFSDRDAENLQALSREIAENVQRVESIKLEEVSMSDPDQPPAAVGFGDTDGEQAGRQPRIRDFLSSALLVGVILLALALGWIVGRPHRRVIKTRLVAPVNQSLPAQAQALPKAGPVTGEQGTNEPKPTASTKPVTTPTPPQPSQAIDNDDGLIIFRDGKVIYRSSPGESANQTPNVAPGSTAAPVRLRSEIAEGYITKRVEPEYPADAKRLRIQGPVILDVLVGSDGAVQKVSPISGNRPLVDAATRAVQMWQFQPFLLNNQPQAFTTRLTIMFRLP